MLTRQKIILSLLQAAHNPVGRIRLFKYAFLLSREWNLDGSTGFYDFVPYRYGPYSFALDRELQILERYGYVERTSDSLGVPNGMKKSADQVMNSMPASKLHPVHKILSKYENWRQRELLTYVYENYSSFTFRSELRDLVPPGIAAPAIAPPKIYTLGYQGKSIDSFFNFIIQQGLSGIVDVRANPISRKYGFAKSTLSLISKKLNVQYWHIPELGIPSQERRGLGTTLSHTKLFDDYESRVLSSCLTPRERAIEVLAAQPSVLVCMEDNPLLCHRSRLAKCLAPQSGMPIHHF